MTILNKTGTKVPVQMKHPASFEEFERLDEIILLEPPISASIVGGISLLLIIFGLALIISPGGKKTYPGEMLLSDKSYSQTASFHGTVKAIMTSNGQEVLKNQAVISLVDTPVIQAVRTAQNISKELPDRPFELQPSPWPHALHLPPELESNYTSLRNAHQELSQASSTSTLKLQMVNLQERQSITDSAISIQREILIKTTDRKNRIEAALKRFERLYEHGGISLEKFENINDQRIASSIEIRRERNALDKLLLDSLEILSSIMQIQENWIHIKRSSRRTLEENIARFNAACELWRSRNIIQSDRSGIIELSSKIRLGSSLVKGEEIFHILKDKEQSTSYFLAEVPTEFHEAVRPDHKFYVILDEYPYNEYGYLRGELQSSFNHSFSLGTESPVLQVTLRFSTPLTTTKNKEIKAFDGIRGKLIHISYEKNMLELVMDKIFFAKDYQG
jgi:hypothetical protein